MGVVHIQFLQMSCWEQQDNIASVLQENLTIIIFFIHLGRLGQSAYMNFCFALFYNMLCMQKNSHY